MSEENAVSPVFTILPEAPRADSDTQLLEIWLHGRSRHTQRAYRADVERFLAWGSVIENRDCGYFNAKFRRPAPLLR